MVNEQFNILKLLVENQETEFSIRQISKIRKINYKSAYNVIQKLTEQGVINVKKLGNNNSCSFNHNFNELVFNVEYARKNKLIKKNKDFAIICEDLSNINNQFIAIISGSYAKGKATKNSDIDLLIITDNIKPIQQKLSLLPLNIHVTDINYSDFMQMLKSKENTVVSEVIKKNIILNGIEDYYRLIKNAK